MARVSCAIVCSVVEKRKLIRQLMYYGYVLVFYLTLPFFASIIDSIGTLCCSDREGNLFTTIVGKFLLMLIPSELDYENQFVLANYFVVCLLQRY